MGEEVIRWPGLRPGPELLDAPFNFLYTHAGGSPVRWSATGPIRFTINPVGADSRDRALALTQNAIARVAEATAFRFEYVGTTRDLPSRERPVLDRGQWAPLLVAWSTDNAPDPARAASGSCGFGGPELVATSQCPVPVYVTGQVTIEAAARATVPGWSDEDWTHVLLHELGHVMGLGHVSDLLQVMSPHGHSGTMSARFGSGDLAGLRLLGAWQPPLLAPSPRRFARDSYKWRRP